MKISYRRAAITGGLTAGSLVLLAAPASAHVSVEPEEAPRGGFSTVNFKVPNERDDSATEKLEVTFPSDQPLVSVMPQPVPGWDIKVSKSKLDKPVEMHGEKVDKAVTKITWSGGKIAPGEFQQFPVSVGQLPEKGDQLVFKALQTYDNDEVVRWIEEPQEGEKEPEHPAPVLKLTAADGQHGGSAGTGGADDSKGSGSESADNSENTAASSDDGGTDNTARALGTVGIVVGAGGIAFGVLAGRRRTS